MEDRMTFAQRMSRLGTETAFEVLARARALEATGREVVHLEIGEPDFDTPRFIRQAAAAALEEGFTHYGPSAGLPEFRQAIAEIWRRERGIPCDADHVVVTPGAKPIMFFAMLALLEEGDEVLYPNPGFPIYESVANFINARPVPLLLREHRDLRPAGGAGRAHRAAGRGARHGRGVPRAAEPDGRGPERAPRPALLRAARGVLRVPEHHRHRPQERRAREAPARGGGRRLPL